MMPARIREWFKNNTNIRVICKIPPRGAKPWVSSFFEKKFY
jgi:hypothetical protein